MKYTTLLITVFAASSLLASDFGYSPVGAPAMPEQKAPSEVIYNNRPLVKVAGKTISLVDVIKKMNIFVHQYAPDLFDSKVSLYQFYFNSWRSTLDELINNELILLEATEKEVKVSDGDVREEMEERFGPNIMTKLDKLGLQYEEARQIVQVDLKVRQLMWYKVHAKAKQTITPSVVKSAFKQHLAQNPPLEEWDYQVLSIRGKNGSFCEDLAKSASTLLREEAYDLQTTASKLKEVDNLESKKISINVSEEFHADSKSISDQHRKVLETLAQRSFSAPTLQKSRVDNSSVYRIFYLKSYTKKEAPQFNDMFENLENDLLGKASDIEKKRYIKLLEKKFNFNRNVVSESLPDNYVPFALN